MRGACLRRKHIPPATTDLREAVVLGLALVGYSNGVALLSKRGGQLPDGTFRVLNPFLVALMLAYAARRPGGLAGVGLRREGLVGSLVGGVGVGLWLAVPPLLFFHKPLLLDTPLEYGPVSGFTRRELLEDIFLRVPVGIAVLEELGFRGLLYAALRGGLRPGAAIAVSAATFACWHFVVTATSTAQTNLNASARLPRLLRPYVQPIAILGGLLSTGVAGLAFGALRERSGNLAGPVVAHWVVDSLIIAALWRRRPRPPDAVETL